MYMCAILSFETRPTATSGDSRHAAIFEQKRLGAG